MGEIAFACFVTSIWTCLLLLPKLPKNIQLCELLQDHILNVWRRRWCNFQRFIYLVIWHKQHLSASRLFRMKYDTSLRPKPFSTQTSKPFNVIIRRQYISASFDDVFQRHFYGYYHELFLTSLFSWSVMR